MIIKFSEDVSDFLSVLSTHDVRYLVVGGRAVIYYGYARLTGDIDILFENTRENVLKLYSALNEFWDSNIPNVSHEDEMMQKGIVIQFGLPPNRIDLINEIEQVDFQEAWNNKVDDRFLHHGKEVTIHYIGLDDLIRNKKAAGRNKDLDDLRFLNRVPKK